MCFYSLLFCLWEYILALILYQNYFVMDDKKIERFSKGVAMLRYISTHKPDGADIVGLDNDISSYCNLMIEHYRYYIKRLNECYAKLNENNADGWYQRMCKKRALKEIDEQRRFYESEIISFNDMLSRLN